MCIFHRGESVQVTELSELNKMYMFYNRLYDGCLVENISKIDLDI